MEWAVSVFQDFGALQSSVVGCWCGRQGVQDTTIQALLTCSVASCQRLSGSRLQSLPAVLAILASTASITAQLAQAALAASPRPPSRSGPIPQQPTFHLRRRNPSTSSSPHHLVAWLRLSTFSLPTVSFVDRKL